MPEINAQQIADWNGNSGRRWLINQMRLDRMLAPYGEAAIAAAAPAPGEQALDIGCGAGTTTLEIAARVGADGHVLGLDISEPLIDGARVRTPTGSPATFQLGDASVTPLPHGRFDLLFSRFGVMFFDDPAAAFGHMRKALKPGGRLAFVCWRTAAENDWIDLPLTAIQGLVPPLAKPGPEDPGPFSFGDPHRIRRILEAAGFVDIALEPQDHPILYGEGETTEAAVEDALDLALEVGPLSRALTNQPDPVRRQACDAVRAAFAGRLSGKSVVIRGAGWIVTAGNSDD
jgi:SAM-dependent methyltransferase